MENPKGTKTVRVKLRLSRGTLALLRAIEKDRAYVRKHPMRIR